MDLDRAMRTVAEHQHGLVAAWQEPLVGATADAVRHRLDAGEWTRPVAGVLRLEGSRRSWEQRLMAAVLHAGPGAVASHRSAAALWGLPGFPTGGWIEVTRRRSGRRTAPAVGVRHETRILPPHHVTVVDDIPVTVVARTLFDCAGVLNPARVERALDNALAMRLTTPERLTVTGAELAARGRAGRATMAALLAERIDPGYVPPASEAEAVLVALFQGAGMPLLLRQVNLGGDHWVGRVDFLVAGTNLVIEVQSYRHHSSKLDMEADARRFAGLTADGFRVLPVTWRDLTKSPEAFLGVVRRAFEARSAA